MDHLEIRGTRPHLTANLNSLKVPLLDELLQSTRHPLGWILTARAPLPKERNVLGASLTPILRSLLVPMRICKKVPSVPTGFLGLPGPPTQTRVILLLLTPLAPVTLNASAIDRLPATPLEDSPVP